MMMVGCDEGKMPKFYGSTTVGERGQVVIPSEARRDLGIAHADKLLVFGDRHGVFFARAESLTGFMTKAKGMLAQIEESVNDEEA
jgi:AbrB family looped-hinge helix DNA binding protein